MQLERKLDTQTAIKRKLDGETYKEIGADYGISPQAVQQRICKLIQKIDGSVIKQYDKNEDAILTHAKQLMVHHATQPEVLKKASLNNAAYAFAQFNGAQRLLRGEATSNVSIKGIIGHHQKTLEDIDSAIQSLEDKEGEGE